MLELISTIKDVKEALLFIQKKFQDRKVSILFETISKELNENFSGNNENFQSELSRLSNEEWFKKYVNQTVVKAALANSTIAVRMMAIAVAVKVKEKQIGTYEDYLLLRVLQDISDFEILYLFKIFSAKKRGIMSPMEYDHYSYSEDSELADRNLFIVMTNNLQRFDLIKVRESLGGLQRAAEFSHFTVQFIDLYKRASLYSEELSH